MQDHDGKQRSTKYILNNVVRGENVVILPIYLFKKNKYLTTSNILYLEN